MTYSGKGTTTVPMNRRELLGTIGVGAPALLLAREAAGKPASATAVPAFAGKNAVVPLPFDPK